MKNHSRNLHAPLCGRFHPNSVAVARYGALIRAKSPTNCDAHLAESLFQTRSSIKKPGLQGNPGKEQSSLFVRHDPEFHGRVAENYLNQNVQNICECRCKCFGNTDVYEKALAVSRKCCRYKHQHNCKYNVFRYSLLKRCIGFEIPDSSVQRSLRSGLLQLQPKSLKIHINQDWTRYYLRN